MHARVQPLRRNDRDLPAGLEHGVADLRHAAEPVRSSRLVEDVFHIDALSRKYMGQDYANPIGSQGRVILRIAADKTNTPAVMSST